MNYCCDYFKRIAGRFKWFTYTDDDNKTFYIMPHISDSEGIRVRVNNCPVCGGDVRSIEIPEEEFKTIKA